MKTPIVKKKSLIFTNKDFVFKVIKIIFNLIVGILAFLFVFALGLGIVALVALVPALGVYFLVPWVFSIPALPFLKVWGGTFLFIWLVSLVSGKPVVDFNAKVKN